MSRIRFIGVMAAAASVLCVSAQQFERASEVRITPVEERELTAADRELLGTFAAQPGRTQQLFRICVREPEMCRAWVGITQSFSKLPLSVRDRELVILRTSWLCGNEYTWAHHIPAAKRAGLSEQEIARIIKGPQAGGWSASDMALLEATDALHKDQFVPDPLWKARSVRYNEREMQDLIYIVGQYTFAAMWARSAGLPLEPGVSGFPK